MRPDLAQSIVKMLAQHLAVIFTDLAIMFDETCFTQLDQFILIDPVPAMKTARTSIIPATFHVEHLVVDVLIAAIGANKTSLVQITANIRTDGVFDLIASFGIDGDD